MARRYRAGTAFVEVAPVFRDFQKRTAREMRRALNDKSVYDGMEDRIEKALDEGARRGHKKIEVQSADAGRRSGRKFSGAYYDEVAKAGRRIERTLRNIQPKGAPVEYQRLLRNAVTEARNLQKAMDGVGEINRTRVQKSFRDIQRTISQMSQIPGLSRKEKFGTRVAQQMVQQATPIVMQGLTPEEVNEQKKLRDRMLRDWDADLKEQARREQRAAREQKKIQDQRARDEQAFNRKREREQERANRKRLNDIKAFDRNLRNLEAESRKRRLADERRGNVSLSNLAEERYREAYSTGYQSFQEPGSGRGGNTKQQRIAEERERTIRQQNRRVQELLRSLTQLNSRRFNVNVESADAVRKLENLQQRLTRMQERVKIDVDAKDLQAEVQRVRAMVNSLSDEEIDIDLHDAEARRKLERLRALKKTINDEKFTADLDQASLRRMNLQIRQATAGIRKIDVEADTDGAQADILALKAALDRLRGKTVGVDVTARDAQANIHAVERALAALRDKNVDIDIDTAGALAQIAATRAALSALDRSFDKNARAIRRQGISLTETTQAFRLFSPVLLGLVVLGPPVIAGIGGIAAALGGLVAAVPPAIGAIGGVALAFKGLGEISEAKEKLEEAKAAMDGTEAAAKRLKEAQEEYNAAIKDQQAAEDFLNMLDRIDSHFNEVARNLRKGFFPELTNGFELLLNTYQEPMLSFAEEYGFQLGGIAERWSKMLASDDAAAWFSRAGENTRKFTDDIAVMTENFVIGIGHMADAFTPFGHEMSDWFVEFSEGFNQWAASLADNPKFIAFIDVTRDFFASAGPFFKELLELVISLAIALEPFASVILDVLTGFMEFLNNMDPGTLAAITGIILGLIFGLQILAGVMSGMGAAMTVISAIASGPLVAVVAVIAGIGAALFATVGLLALFRSEGVAAFDEVLEKMGVSEETIQELKDAFGSWAGIFDPIKEGIEDSFGPLMRLHDDVMPTLQQFADDAVAAFAKVIEAVEPFVRGLMEFIGESIIPTIVDVMEKVWPMVEDLIGGLGSLFEILGWLWENVLGPIMENFMNTLKFLWNGIIAPLLDVVLSLVEVIFSLFLGPLLDFMKVLTGDMSIAEWAESVKERALEAFGGLVDSILNFFLDFAVALADWFVATWELIDENFGDIITSIVEWTRDFWISIGEMIVGWITDLWEALSQWWSDIDQGFQDMLTSVQTWWEDVWGAISDWFTDITSGIKRTASGWMRDLKSTIQRGVNEIRDWWNDPWQKMSDFVTGLWEKMPDKFKDAIKGIGGFIDTYVIKPFNSLMETLQLGSLKIPTFEEAAKASGRGRGASGARSQGQMAYADGGVIPGYTPGRDVHTFYSPTAGVLELSGGEPILRPEVGLVLGHDWVDSVNAAARKGGVSGVRRALGGQAFATGGFFGLPHQAFANGGTLMQAADWWIARGAKASRHSRFNGGRRITSGHSRNSLHYQDRAVDFNFAPGTSAYEMRMFDKFLPAFKAAFPNIRTIWRAPGHYNHLHIDTGRGADIGTWSGGGGGGGMDPFSIIKGYGEKLREKIIEGLGDNKITRMGVGVGERLIGGAVDKVRDMWNGFTDIFEGDAGSSSTGPAKSQGQSWAQARGLGRHWSDIDFIVSRESGWNPKAKNPRSSAAGLPQFIAANQRHYGVYPITNFPVAKQLDAMHRYVMDRYGSWPSAASYWRRNRHYADGGIMDLLGTGRPMLHDQGGEVPRGYSIIHNALPHSETTLPFSPKQLMEALKSSSPRGGDGGVTLTFPDARFEGNPDEIADSLQYRQQVALMEVNMAP